MAYPYRAGGGSVALFLWASFLVASAGGYIETRVRERNEVRQARYDACLERTTPEICELHWVEQPAHGSNADTAGVPAFVITPSGGIGLGVGL